MQTLQEATEKICELKGSVLALECITAALVQALSPAQRAVFAAELGRELEACETMLLGAVVSEWTVKGFQHDAQRASTRWARA
jgi:hypothetical protein